MKLAVVGTGYVGLVTGSCLAELGHNVTCVDIDATKIGELNNGVVSIFEPGLTDLVERGRRAGRLRFTTDLGEAMPGSSAVFIAVGTPSDSSGRADLSQVTEAADGIAELMDPGTLVVVKSTVPVGTTRHVADQIHQTRPGVDFEIGANPEFLRQGVAVTDFMHPDRLVIGTATEAAEELLRHIYQPLIGAGVTTLFVGIETAELIKYASNSFLAIKLSFVNEVADLCEAAGANIDEVANGMGLDTRITHRFLSAGPGFGGSCLPKDTQALLHTSQVLGAPSRVVAAAVDANRDRKRHMANKIAAAAGGSVQGKTIAVLGLAFKANTDDLRESPAIAIVRSLIGLGATIRAYDPEAVDNARAVLPTIEYAADAYEAIDGADLLVIVTEWPEFATLDLSRVYTSMASPVIVDLRNLYNPSDMAELGFAYHSIGRPPVGLPDDSP